MNNLNINQFFPKPKGLSKNTPVFKLGLKILFVCGLYWLGMLCGGALSLRPSQVSIFWPPPAIAIAVLLMTKPRKWWMYLFAIAVVDIGWHFIHERELWQFNNSKLFWMSLGFYLANIIQLLIAAGALWHFLGGPPRFDRLKDIVIYVIFTVILAPFISALAGSFVSHFIGAEVSYWPTVFRWFLGSLMVHLTLTPLVLIWLFHRQRFFKVYTFEQYAEMGIILFALCIICFYVFGDRIEGFDKIPVLIFLPFPLLIWAALRFGPKFIYSSLFMVVLIATMFSIKGYGPFSHLEPQESVLSLQIFIVIFSLPLIFLNSIIQEQQNSKEILRKSEERFALAMRGANDGLFDWNVITNEVYYSPRYKEMLGYSEREFESNFTVFESLLHPDDKEKVMTTINECLAGVSESFTCEFKMRHKDGHYVDILSRGFITHSADRKPLRFLGTHVDITERIKYETDLAKAKEAAEAANIAKSLFLANMSHEIRTPMNGIIGMTDILLMTGLTEKQKEYLTILKISADTLLRVVNDILDYSKIEAGIMVIEKSPFSLNTTIKEVIDLFNITAKQKGLIIHYIFDASIPEAIKGDPVRLRQVLSNLIGNAVKFTFEGNINVNCIMEEKDESFVKVSFVISDTGIGIAEDNLNRLFKTFSQVDDSQSKKFGGAGLGLAISKKIVELMGGKIWVESKEDEGSSFFFTVTFET